MQIFKIPYIRKGAKIKIKEKNKEKFTKSAEAAGHTVQEHAKAILNNPNSTSLQKKRANFARNAAKWKHLDGGLILMGLIPGVGTYLDIVEFTKNPTLTNFGWALASGIGDVLFFTGASAGIKALRLAKAASNARKGIITKRSVKLLDAKNNFYNTRNLKVLGILNRNIKPELESLRQSVDNYRNALIKYKVSRKNILNLIDGLKKKAFQDIGKDVIINTTLAYTN